LKRLDELKVIDASTIPKPLFDEWKDQPEFCVQISRDLRSYGLTDLMSPWDAEVYRTHHAFGREHNVTDLGKKFLQFIASPLEDE
jgi:hypothetical protein